MTRTRTFLAAVVVTVLLAACGVAMAAVTAAPVNLFGSTVPANTSDPDTQAVTLGLRFEARVAGNITGVRFYKGARNTGTHTGLLYSSTGAQLKRQTFTGETATGWQSLTFTTPLTVAAGQAFTAAYRAPRGRYAEQHPYPWPVENASLRGTAGTYRYGSIGYPTQVWEASNYFVDVTFEPATSPTPTSTTSTTSTPTSSTSTTTSPTSTTSTTTSPTSTTTTTTTSPPTGQLNCAPNPSACGYPDATNTGVTPGTALQASTCPAGNTNGQVIQNLLLDGCDINVTAQNVTIRNVKLTHSWVDGWAIIIRNGASARIENVEVAGRDKTGGSVQYAILSQATAAVTVDRANLHRCADCIQGERVTVTNSYIHDMANPPGAHVDGFQSNGESGVTLRHNTILNEYGQTAAVALFADFGTPRDSVVDDNILAGGGYTVYPGYTSSTGIRIINNRFSRIYFPTSGQYGPGTRLFPNAGNVWSGNVWDDTGSPVPAP